MIDVVDIWSQLETRVPILPGLVIFIGFVAWNLWRGNHDRLVWRSLFWSYLATLLFVAIWDSQHMGFSFNLMPFASLGNLVRTEPAGVAFRQVFLNVLMYAPLGVLLPLAYQRMDRISRVLYISAAMAVGVEATQLLISMASSFSANKTVDIDNVILGVAGACLAYGVYRLVRVLTALVGGTHQVQAAATSR